MRKCVFAAALFFGAQATASAEVPSNAKGCDGILCVLMPVYRVGKTLLNLDPDTKALPPPPPQAAQAPPAEPASSQDRPPVQTITNTQNQSDGNGRTSDDTKDADDAMPTEKTTKSSSRGVTSTRLMRIHNQNIVRRAKAPEQLRQSISIGAYGPDLKLMETLSAIIKEPRITAVEGQTDNCDGRPVDFTVDALQNPDRRGPAIPLYDENLIILAPIAIKEIQDLKGRKVSFGPSGGPSASIARRLFNALNLQVEETPLDFDNAVDALGQRAIDALAVLVPRGSNQFASLGSGLHVLAVPERITVADGVRTSLISPASYLGATWSHSTIRVLTVEAVLSPNPKAKQPQAAPALFASLDRNSARLAENGFDLIGGEELMTMRSVARDIQNPVQGFNIVGLRCGHRYR